MAYASCRTGRAMRTLPSLLALTVLSMVLVGAAPTGRPVGPHDVGCNVSEIMTEHLHTQLSITAHGKPVPVPANIGIVNAAGAMLCIYWLHTHDQSGQIHVEAPMGTFTLADFFAVWGQPLSTRQVGPYRGKVSAKVNGAPFRGAPQDIPLLDGEKIALSVN